MKAKKKKSPSQISIVRRKAAERQKRFRERNRATKRKKPPGRRWVIPSATEQYSKNIELLLAQKGDQLRQHQAWRNAPAMEAIREAAMRRLTAMKEDRAWTARYVVGGTGSPEFTELHFLLRIIADLIN